MEQTELLWQYQKADVAADNFEAEIKHHPIRLSMKKNRDFLLEQQNAIKKMEQDVLDRADRVEIIKAASEKLSAQLEKLNKQVESNPPQTLAEAQAFSKESQRLIRDLEDYSNEISKIRKDAADCEKQEREIRVKYAKTKAEYEKQTAEFDAQFKEMKKELDEKRAAVAAKEAEIDPKLMEKYKAIKKHCAKPVAKLYNGQCGGCNMGLPQAELRKFKAEDCQYIECENCGRIIIQ